MEYSSFEHLSKRVQIGRLRLVARAALSAYDLGKVRLTLLAHLFNTTFRVDAEDGQRYVLRIHRAGKPTRESVGAELAWLAAIRRDTNLEVPSPVPTRSGQMLTVISLPGVSQAEARQHICALFRWLDGRRLVGGLTPAHLERVGILMARLQDHAAHFGPPQGFARGRVDYPVDRVKGLPDPFASEVISECHALVADTLSDEEAAMVVDVLERIRAAEQALGNDSTTFGLMHADLHQYNLLFAHKTVKALDFDDCGFGPLLYDMAVPLAMLQGRKNYPALRAALLKGYRQIRPLSAQSEAYLDTFIALRHLQDGLWVLEWRKHPAISYDWAAQARQSLALIRSFLDNEGHFSDHV